jgi:hypothetical protein
VAVVHEQPVAVVAQVAEPLVVAAAAVRGQPAAAEAEADGPRTAVRAAPAYSALGVAVAASAA